MDVRSPGVHFDGNHGVWLRLVKIEVYIKLGQKKTYASFVLPLEELCHFYRYRLGYSGFGCNSEKKRKAWRNIQESGQVVCPTQFYLLYNFQRYLLALWTRLKILVTKLFPSVARVVPWKKSESSSHVLPRQKTEYSEKEQCVSYFP